MSQREQRPEARRPGSVPGRLAGGFFGVIAAVVLAQCGFPDFGGFVDGADASLGGTGGSSTGGSAGTAGDGGSGGTGGTAGDGGSAGSATGGVGGTDTGGAAGTAGEAGSAGTGGTSTGGTGGSNTGGTGGTSGTGGTGGTAGTGGGTGGVGGDAGPETILSLLNVWHIPTNPEPPTTTMRNPVLPDAATTDVFVYVGEFRPEGKVASGSLIWWWSDALTSTQPQTVPLTYDSHNGNNDYWRASMTMPARRVGTFKYYVQVVPEDTSTYATTWLYGSDSVTNKTATESVAVASPYRPTFAAPAPGELVVTEVMVNAFGSVEGNKEWFELVSTAAGPVSMNGLLLADSSDANIHTINAPDLIVWPGVYTTFGATADSSNLEGFTADYAYGNGMSFSNSSNDSVRVMLADKTAIDAVAWTSAAAWPCHTDARTMQYNTATPVSTGNDLSTDWCESKKTYGTGTSYGTPNAATDGCVP